MNNAQSMLALALAGLVLSCSASTRPKAAQNGEKTSSDADSNDESPSEKKSQGAAGAAPDGRRTTGAAGAAPSRPASGGAGAVAEAAGSPAMTAKDAAAAMEEDAGTTVDAGEPMAAGSGGMGAAGSSGMGAAGTASAAGSRAGSGAGGMGGIGSDWLGNPTGGPVYCVTDKDCEKTLFLPICSMGTCTTCPSVTQASDLTLRIDACLVANVQNCDGSDKDACFSKCIMSCAGE